MLFYFIFLFRKSEDVDQDQRNAGINKLIINSRFFYLLLNDFWSKI